MIETIAEMPALQLTAAAAAKIRALANQQGGRPLLRVYIQGGGCSGFQYGFDFADQPADDDAVFGSGEVSVLVDPMSYQYLMGAEIDFKEDLQGARFVINNPNATITCGCGSSFGV